MDPARFESSAFGQVVADGNLGYPWFRPAPIQRDFPLDAQTLLALSRADEALGRLAGVAQLIRNPRILMRPYAFKESLASARIEGTQADLGGVFEAERHVAGGDPDLLTVSRYLRALETGLGLVNDESKAPDFELIRTVHTLLLGLPKREEVRADAVWLGSPTDRPETAVYVPPIGDAVTDALADWQDYVQHPPALPTLIRAAILHYQFLTIHPFRDGNGRAGRLFVLLFLAAEGRLPTPLLYLSPFFERRRRDYYDRLQAVRERGELQQWCQFFLTAVEAQANDGVVRAGRLLELRETYRSALAGTRSRSAEVVEMLFENPIITTHAVREQLGVTAQGALNLIRSLETRGWLKQLRKAGRGGGTLWLAPEVFMTMEDEPAGARA